MYRLTNNQGIFRKPEIQQSIERLGYTLSHSSLPLCIADPNYTTYFGLGRNLEEIPMVIRIAEINPNSTMREKIEIQIRKENEEPQIILSGFSWSSVELEKAPEQLLLSVVRLDYGIGDLTQAHLNILAQAELYMTLLRI